MEEEDAKAGAGESLPLEKKRKKERRIRKRKNEKHFKRCGTLSFVFVLQMFLLFLTLSDIRRLGMQTT